MHIFVHMFGKYSELFLKVALSTIKSTKYPLLFIMNTKTLYSFQNQYQFFLIEFQSSDSTSSFVSDNSFEHDEAHMYVCSKQSEEGTENPYSHMSHISEGTPYSNNFVTEQYT